MRICILYMSFECFMSEVINVIYIYHCFITDENGIISYYDNIMFLKQKASSNF